MGHRRGYGLSQLGMPFMYAATTELNHAGIKPRCDSQDNAAWRQWLIAEEMQQQWRFDHGNQKMRFAALWKRTGGIFHRYRPGRSLVRGGRSRRCSRRERYFRNRPADTVAYASARQDAE